ncbi:Por secretion system C-terminal sorting domain-containing protein [Reichenbachiella agariperforans]|uniref:Por secretion system C-terminal sorting domain-containing protein n=1 Tax=Reichenbachiella agariperforans TaxID=156994 RepID=A0A1M6JST5_REIAG|nr:MBG domain-containing protein [Reichenbachiella agariperforans]SHJ49729.1 Por secretion system C-terminal sorting domain-containing protein [Reichenbachiella agariperforans]
MTCPSLILTFTYAGLVNGESGNDLLSEPTITTTTNNTSDAGTYPITLSGGASDNYDISLQDGTLTINKVDQVISIDQIDDKAPTDVDFDVVASMTSGLTLTYDISGPATITGTTISLHGTHGTVTLTVTQAGDINHNAASESITFEVQVITDVTTFDTAIRIYPNPAVHELVITGAEHSAVKMFSLDGKLVKQVTLSHQKLNIGDLENGTYLVEISQGQERAVRKVVKVN